MKKIFSTYQQLDAGVLNLILAEMCLQIINGAFFLLLNLYMTKNGYTDTEIAQYVSWRYVAVVVLAVPFGLYISKRRILPLMWWVSVILPAVSLLLLECIERHWAAGVVVLAVVWGVVFNLVSIPIIPYILRHTAEQSRSEAIALHTATWSASQIIAGLGIAVLSGSMPHLFSEKILLQLFSVLGLGALFFLSRIRTTEQVPEVSRSSDAPSQHQQRQLGLLLRAILPTFIIAVGAGLAVPFMNLFFYHSFGIDSAHFAVLGLITSCVVSVSVLFTPYIKRQMGYRAIIITQLASIAMLVLMGFADYYRSVAYLLALALALLAYLLRQPLMNLAAPLTSEMTMYYVGKSNRELMSAVTSAVWSGSWFFSSQIFAYLRHWQWSYGAIFLLTALMYLGAVGIYVLLIADFERRSERGLIEFL